MDVQVLMNDIQRKAQVPVKNRIGVSNSSILPTIVRSEITRDEWEGYYGDLDWQLRRRNFKNYTEQQLLQHLAECGFANFVLWSRSEDKVTGEGSRTARDGYKCGRPFGYDILKFITWLLIKIMS